jgi:hypothetical protein
MASCAMANGNGGEVLGSIEWIEPVKRLGVGTIVLFLLLITNIVVLLRFRSDAKYSFTRDVVHSELKNLNSKIVLFYNPLHAMLSMNEDMHKKFGPDTWPDEGEAREEGMHLWEQIDSSVIWMNNKKILNVLTQHAHFVEDEKEAEVYRKLMVYLVSYFAVLERGIVLAKGYKFPGSVSNVVKNARDFLLRKRERLRDELGIYLNEE